MGDKGGKKDKNKAQKQKVAKQEQQTQKKQEKQPKSTPWVPAIRSRIRRRPDTGSSDQRLHRWSLERVGGVDGGLWSMSTRNRAPARWSTLR